jgi:RNA polymerase sigma-70 factor, ECF subfamily
MSTYNWDTEGDRALEFQTFDAEYVARLASGDPETEAHFSLYFGRFLSQKLRSRRLSAETADDVRQETLYRVLKTLRQGKGVQEPQRFGAFVNAVCNNVILESLHKGSRDVAVGDSLPEAEDRAMLADESLITEERKKAVAGILKDMAPKDREILRLVFFEDVAREEICRRMNTDAGYVRVLLHRAKSRFEAAFSKSYRSFAGIILLLCNVVTLSATIWQTLTCS